MNAIRMAPLSLLIPKSGFTFTTTLGRGPHHFVPPTVVGAGVRHASKYRAAVLKEFGKPLVIEEVKRPSLKKDHLRLRVYCCGINSVDRHNVEGDIVPQPKLPFVPGFEVSLSSESSRRIIRINNVFKLQVCGEILEVPETEKNKKLRPGERAIALLSEFSGGFAEEVVVSSQVCLNNLLSNNQRTNLLYNYLQDVWVVDNSMSFEDGMNFRV